AMLLIVGLSILWQEAVYNWSRTNFLYNGYFFNRGNWTEHLPGWVNPTSANNPVPLIFIGLAYVWNPLINALVVSWVLRKAKARWIQLTILQQVGIAFALCVAMDVVTELIYLRTQ